MSEKEDLNSRGDSAGSFNPVDKPWLFKPGNRTSVGHGRPSKQRELELHDASARGCSPERWEKIVRKLCDMAETGDVPAARLLGQIMGVIGTRPVAEGEVGFSLGNELARAGAAELVSDMLNRLRGLPPMKPAREVVVKPGRAATKNDEKQPPAG